MENVQEFSEEIYPYSGTDYSETEEGQELHRIGVELMAYRYFGVIILAGGQGSRLGSKEPKALFKIAGKPLIEHHIRRIKKLIQDYKCHVKLFIMVSSYTEKPIKEYIENNDFGIPIELIKQEDRVCRDNKGMPMYNQHKETLKAPGGNGDVFKAFKDVDLHDYVAVNVVSVDNVMAKVLDPVFVGALVKYDCDIMSKAIKKNPEDKVGVFIIDGRSLRVREYLDMGKDKYYRSGNICNHLFSRRFMELMRDKDLPEHQVLKKIPFLYKGKLIRPNEPNGYKVETFIFDSFAYATRNAYIIVPREYEFAPLKNGPDSKTDNPRTCEEALRRYSKY